MEPTEKYNMALGPPNRTIRNRTPMPTFKHKEKQIVGNEIVKYNPKRQKDSTTIGNRSDQPDDHARGSKKCANCTIM